MDSSHQDVEIPRRRSAPAALEAAGAALAAVREVRARGEAKARSASTPSLRSGSALRGSPSKRAGSKRSPSKSSGAVSGDVCSRQSASQEKVLRALVQTFTSEQSVHDIAVNLLGQIHSQEGAVAFTRESILQAVVASEASLLPAGSKVNTPTWTGGLVDSSDENPSSALLLPNLLPVRSPAGLQRKCSSRSKQASGFGASVSPWDPEPPRRSGSKASVGEAGTSTFNSKPQIFVSAVQMLVSRSNLHFHEVAGQILFRHRRSSVIQERKDFRKVAEDLSWVFRQSSSDTESEQKEEGQRKRWVDAVFEHMCVKGEFRFREWQKVVQLIQRNPILKSRVRLSDADRLFYNITHRDTEARNSLTSAREFRELLMCLAEACEIHPGVMFYAVGCHDRSLAEAALDARVTC